MINCLFFFSSSLPRTRTCCVKLSSSIMARKSSSQSTRLKVLPDRRSKMCRSSLVLQNTRVLLSWRVSGFQFLPFFEVPAYVYVPTQEPRYSRKRKVMQVVIFYITKNIHFTLKSIIDLILRFILLSSDPKLFSYPKKL